jgi:DNA-directed RNA polymerase specialized sigma24 family protein
LLAFLLTADETKANELTADETKAEESFVSSLEDCVKGNREFRDWAQSWARRRIIRNAVRMLAPRRNRSSATPVAGHSVYCKFGRTSETYAALASILGLKDFERFVFVMSVLYKYSDQDCSVLLECSRQDVRETRTRALQHLAESDRICAVTGSEVNSKDYEESRIRESNHAPTLGIGSGVALKE